MSLRTDAWQHYNCCTITCIMVSTAWFVTHHGSSMFLQHLGTSEQVGELMSAVAKPIYIARWAKRKFIVDSTVFHILLVCFILKMSRQSCVNHPYNLCYICGKYTPCNQRKNLTKRVTVAYKYYFECKFGDQDKSWAL